MMPGVESKKVMVIINVMMPPILPMAEIFGEKGLQQIKTPNAISTMPNTFEKPSTPNKPYVHDKRGLLSTKGFIPSAS